MMFALFSSPFSVDAQRIRYGYEWPCWETPPPPSFPPPTEIPDICQTEEGEFHHPIEIGEGTKYPDSQSLGTQVSNNEEFVVIGDFHINSDYTAESCKFKTLPNTTIFIDGVTFTSQGSLYFCCGAMWNGIKLRENASIRFEKSKIEDARIGIECPSEASDIRIQNSTFNRDEIGIYARGGVSSSYIPLNIFAGNTFSCTSPLNKGSNYPYTSIGFKISLAQIPLLGTDGEPNVFTGRITLGIASFLSEIYVNNCLFTYISKGTNPATAIPKTNGLGIWAEQGTLVVNGLGKDDDPKKATFVSCTDGGIKSIGANLFVENCFFDFVSTPIFQLKNSLLVESIDNKNGQFITISDNTFKTNVNAIGIKLERSDAITNEIWRNDFLSVGVATKTTKCIVVDKGYSLFNSTMLIIDNKIKGSGSTSETLLGITLNRGRKYHVENNVMENFSSQTNAGNFGIGVLVTNCGASSFKFNKISSQNNNSNTLLPPTSTGFKFVNTSLNNSTSTDAGGKSVPTEPFFVCNNNSKFMKKGFLFEGNNNNTIFADNELDTNDSGLELVKNGDEPIIGRQWDDDKFRKNTWGGSAGMLSNGITIGARMLTGLPDDSQFFVNDKTINMGKSIFPIGGIDVPSGFTTNDWFFSDKNIQVSDIGCNTFTFPSGNKWTPFYDNIINEKYNSENEVNKWESQRYLYRIMAADPSLIDGQQERIAFFESCMKGSVAKFNQLQDAKENVFINPEFDESINTLQQEHKVLWEHLIVLVKSYSEIFAEKEWDTANKEEVRVLAKEVADLANKIEQKGKERDEQIVKKAAELMDLAKIIETNTNYEKIAQTMTFLWAKAITQNGHLDEADLATVRTIANDCIYVVGSALYDARDMTPTCEWRESPCKVEILTRKVKAQESFGVLSPNPANTELFLNIEKPEDIKSIEIKDISGKTLQTIANEGIASKLRIDVASFKDGVHFVAILDNNGNLVTHKFIVIH